MDINIPERFKGKDPDQIMNRAKEIIAWGSSTCSKAPSMRPYDPAAIAMGKGCRVWDIEGREYIDYRNSLGPITLGYQFPEVDEAIKKQLERGIVYGHPSIVEYEVAEMLVEVIPAAEQVRFLKTGGESAAACIRLARAHTGKDHIIHVGYNGWLNSLAHGGPVLPNQAGSSSGTGVPKCLADLHHTAPWNNMAKVEEIFDSVKGNVAGLIIAADYATMALGETYYKEAREFCDKNGVVLIYDEIVTGFRIAIGGVQEYFGVTPDLCVFSKGVANGMPLSFFAGKNEIMNRLNRGGGVTVSSTFGGEALSLAAARAAITVYKEQDVVGYIWKTAESLWTNLNKVFAKKDVPLEVKGFWPCPIFALKEGAPGDTSANFIKMAYKNGVSLYNVSYVNFSHKQADIDETLQKLEKACDDLKNL